MKPRRTSAHARDGQTPGAASRRNVLLAALLFGITAGAESSRAASLDQLSSSDASAGLKAALNQGVSAAVAGLGRPDGFWSNAKVRIPLPENMQHAKSAMRLMGRSHEFDDLERAVNRAAEQAVPEARDLLSGAVKSMTVDDAKGILRGGDDSVTQFFKAKTAPQLTERFLPIVSKVTAKNGLAQQYNSLAGQAAQFGLVKTDEATIERYVTHKALDGLYTMIGEEERKIRANPMAAGSDLVKRVFGALK